MAKQYAFQYECKFIYIVGCDIYKCGEFLLWKVRFINCWKCAVEKAFSWARELEKEWMP